MQPDQVARTARPLPLASLPQCEHDLQWIAPSVGHTGDLYRCKHCGGYTMRGLPVGPRN